MEASWAFSLASLSCQSGIWLSRFLTFSRSRLPEKESSRKYGWSSLQHKKNLLLCNICLFENIWLFLWVQCIPAFTAAMLCTSYFVYVKIMERMTRMMRSLGTSEPRIPKGPPGLLTFSCALQAPNTQSSSSRNCTRSRNVMTHHWTRMKNMMITGLMLDEDDNNGRSSYRQWRPWSRRPPARPAQLPYAHTSIEMMVMVKVKLVKMVMDQQ